MAHGMHCDCAMCSVGKKMGMIKDEHEGERHDEHEPGHEKKYVCQSCGSEAHNKAGFCCGGERQAA